ncbi:MAG: phospho-N-acetylmuramoyl-pentapeptide-transferase [Trueperaceae bacterium]|nr:phospho-N-acetylmuramoyl-pentapeptide-transferase [Trueperaceae bacterium]
MIIFGSALLSLVFVGIFVQLAKRYGWGKSVRRDGPASHLAKEGTPTMGGVAFLFAAIVSWLLVGGYTPATVAVVLLTVGAGLLGWADDIASLRRKRQMASGRDASTGLLARYRILVQTVLGLAFAIFVVQQGYTLFGRFWLDIPAFTFVIVGSINAINFSDGLDGLAGGLMVILLLPFLGSSYALCLLGALLGFLWYNAQPARVFMGGVGSEALGAALGGFAIIGGWTWWLPLMALVPVLEVVSVIVQVSYFRATGGKRLLRMSPLHHHFELGGWSEMQVVIRFWLVTAVCVALAWRFRGALL